MKSRQVAGRNFNTLARGRGINAVRGGLIYPYKPISNHTRLPNEFGGAANIQLMAQSRHLFFEDMNNLTKKRKEKKRTQHSPANNKVKNNDAI